MTYIPTEWENFPSAKTPIDADNLNKLEQGVKAAHDGVDAANADLNNKFDKDGDPCDIPSGRFVSVRVNMPEDSIYNKKVKEESDLMKEMESNPFYKEERAFPNIIFNKKGDL